MNKRLRSCISLSLALALLLPAIAISPAASPEGGAGGYSWPTGQALPHFGPPADTLDAIDVINMPFAERLAVSCLQGIVNRTQARIFLVDRDWDSRDSWGGALELDYAFAPWKDLILKYRDELKGLIVFNPALQAPTANVATTLAGIKNALAVSPELAAALSAAPYNLPVLVDLREMPIADKLGAYRWLYDNYWDQCTRRTICGLEGHMPLRDLPVAVKAATLWLDPKVPEEQEVLKLFFDDTSPLDCFYTGWWPDEGAGIAFASSYGVTTIPSDFYLNITVYSAMSRELDLPAVPAKPALEDGKIYVSLNFSDGDNIQYDQGAMRIGRLWGSAQRGEVPIGWTFSPSMLDAGPQILNWYYKTATENDVLISGPSGLGYSVSAQWPDKAFTQKYGAMTNDYFERSQFNIITVWSKLTPTRAEWFAGAMPALLGLTTQFEYWQKIRFTSGGTPVVWFGSDVSSSTGAMSYDNGIDNMKERLSAAAEQDCADAQFFMGQADAWHTSVHDFVRLANELREEYPGRFVFVRPDHFMMLLKESYGRPFLVSLQKKAQASRDNGGGPALVTDGSFTTGWESPVPGKAYVEIDLGESVLLDRYVLKNAECAYRDKSLNTKAWELQISADGGRWTTVDAVTGNEAAIVYRGLSKRSARYIRLAIDDPGADNIARVQDLEIYGVPEARANDLATRWKRFAHNLMSCILKPLIEVWAWGEGVYW